MSDPDPTPAAAGGTFRGTKAFERARRVLNGEELEPSEALGLVEQLRRELAYKYAREIAWRYHERLDIDDRLRRKFLSVLVTSTYKDLELPPQTSLKRAWEALQRAGYDPDTTTYPEALGLAGAICKRRWEYDGDTRHLERSLGYYQRAYGGDVTTDSGYQAINAAYVLDLLASLEVADAEPEPSDATRQAVEARRQAARVIRQRLVEELPAKRIEAWWWYATLAEAHFGLGDNPRAEELLKEGLSHPDPEKRPPEWEVQSTIHQLASLARVQGQAAGIKFPEESEASRTIRAAFGEERSSGIHSAFVGKIGLALSGGGFRASLYHIGVLARLAELDVLRHVEVISCVSGGSILGARYYLEVRKLLQDTPDGAIGKDDYVEIVRRLEEEFLRGVQKNLRNRLFSEFGTAMRDAFSRDSVRTERLGEMFEEELYGRVGGEPVTGPCWLNDLHVTPHGHPVDGPAFNPRLQNWRRAAKVPILVLNATTLNTGHTWQFTTSWMGEPPGGSDPRVDPTRRLRRVRYEDAPARYRRMRLGHAVAASACVPGLFDPLVLTGLYPDITVRLVDGGVHDNQGTATLLEQGCTVLLVSDASGQLTLLEEPSAGRVGVPVRANDVLMARVRETQFRTLEEKQKASVLRGVMYVHLKQDLASEPVDWKECPEPNGVWTFDRAAPTGDEWLTTYGMRRDVQHRLARLRTDLDVFSDLEAYALMESGYRATKLAFGPSVPTFRPRSVVEERWNFHDVESRVATVAPPADVLAETLAHLARGEGLFFRASPVLQRIVEAPAAVGRRFRKPGVAKKAPGQRFLALATGGLALPLRLIHPSGTRAWISSGKVK